MAKKDYDTKVEIGQYKGYPMFQIFTTVDGVKKERPDMQFGVTKAKKVLESIDDIKKFVELYSKDFKEDIDVATLSKKEKNTLLAQLLADGIE